jgi:hypothetical protein
MKSFNAADRFRTVWKSEKGLGKGESGKNEDDKYIELLPNI